MPILFQQENYLPVEALAFTNPSALYKAFVQHLPLL
jgi:hypothetical protein